MIRDTIEAISIATVCELLVLAFFAVTIIVVLP